METAKLSLLVFLQLLLVASIFERATAQGLKIGFYQHTCPTAENVIKKTTSKYISRFPTLAAALLRMHFHDCFVRINGPYWNVPTGRRDGKVSVALEALTNLPPPFANITTLKAMFAVKGLNAKDLVVLSGGHTIGRAACAAFNNRLYNFTGRGDADPSLDPNYAANLRKKCGPTDFSTTVEMDPGSYKTFDEDYYTLVDKRRGLFQSDSALLNDPKTKAYVKLQATTQGSTFAKDFAESMVKMGNIGVLTGNAGQIRKHCAFVN
ncbi:hypothetical protein G4B88_018578 [Cannabis sativa]|uniref:Plant heme peroxidase family profile domain-containing protein n=1 Tax=Cannabis sativa TaxID=3483 RepID=A0A7J6HI89_CANSA|nr:hypothetical protein G4B88_018578 [Cannabis sativa]